MAVLLGRTTAGTTADFVVNSDATAWKVTASATGTLATISAQFKVANAGLTNVQVAIYDDSAGGTRPGARLGEGSTTVGITGTGVFTATGFSVSIVSGTVYWLALRGIGEQVDFQGSTAGTYVEDTGAGPFQATWPSAGQNAGTIDIVIYGEDAAVAAGTTLSGRRPDRGLIMRAAVPKWRRRRGVWLPDYAPA